MGALSPHSHPLNCQERQAAAARLGRERRWLYLAGIAVSLLAPVLPYLTGTWETAWYALAATWLPLVIRAGIFLVGFHLALVLLALPLSYYGGFVLAHAFGLSRQRLSGWLADWAKGAALTSSLGSLAGGAYLWTVTAFGGGWWWAFGLLATGATVLLVFLTPYVFVPIFFKMRPLADEATAERIRALLRRAGAEVREISALDFSRRTAEANAAVIGVGRSRRVVLADTLLADFTPEEVDAVVAHELGHHVHRDVPRLLAVSLAIQWIGLALVAWLAPTAAARLLSLPSLAYVPGYPVMLAVAELYLFVVSPLTAWWSRQLESAADRFALQLTCDPPAFASAMRRLGCQNLVEMWPPRWAAMLLGSHPPLGRRIAMAEAAR